MQEKNDNAPALSLTKERTLMLWQLLNAQGTGTPFSAAHVAAGLYSDVREAAEFYGIVKA